MWLFIIFGLGMIALATFMYVGKLHKFKGTKLKTRMKFSLGLSFCLTLFFLWQGEMQGIGKSLLLGGVLCIPLCFYKKRWSKKRIEGTTIFYKRKQYRRNLLRAIPIIMATAIIILFLIFFHVDFGKRILEATWLFLGVAFALFTSQVFLLFYVIKLERKLGTPILEDEK